MPALEEEVGMLAEVRFPSENVTLVCITQTTSLVRAHEFTLTFAGAGVWRTHTQ
jgi:hypothetical protein